MKTYIPSLNGLRGLSILIVILGHLNLKSFNNILIPFPFSLFFDGSFGVNVFFVISGFLITKLLLQEESGQGGVSLKNFYIRRVLRIFPAYYFLLLFYFVLQLFSILHFSKTSWLSSIFYYKYITGGDWESGHFWSLSVEEHFYLVWPFVFTFLKKYRGLFALFIISMVMFFRLNAYMHFWHVNVFDSNLSIFQRGDALMIGCLFALNEGKAKRLLNHFFRHPVVPFIILGLIAFLSSDFLVSWNMKYGLHAGFLIVPLGIGWSIGTLVNILIAVLICVSINGNGFWYAFLNSKAMIWLGKLSYSLYLWQQLFFSDRMGVFSKFPINLFCILIAASGSYYLIEKPFLRWKIKYETIRKKNDDPEVSFSATAFSKA